MPLGFLALVYRHSTPIINIYYHCNKIQELRPIVSAAHMNSKVVIFTHGILHMYKSNLFTKATLLHMSMYPYPLLSLAPYPLPLKNKNSKPQVEVISSGSKFPK